jgi:hypothetical protein
MQPGGAFRAHRLMQHAEKLQQHSVHRALVDSLHRPAQGDVRLVHGATNIIRGYAQVQPLDTYQAALDLPRGA